MKKLKILALMAVEQIHENIAAVKNTDFTTEELVKIDKILG
jgi:aryl-alcohol dehydrogenase-like predicted oxidoreductase